MTVADLIEKLKTFDPELQVYVRYDITAMDSKPFIAELIHGDRAVLQIQATTLSDGLEEFNP